MFPEKYWLGPKLGVLIKIFENPDLFTNLALDNLFQIFGERKGKTFEAVRLIVKDNTKQEKRKRKKKEKVYTVQ